MMLLNVSVVRRMEGSCDVDLKLSSKGLNNLPFELYDGDFSFIVGDKDYKCHHVVAEFLSPKIGKLRVLDPSLCEYHMETEDVDCKFNDFISLALESRLHVEAKYFDFFVSVSRELENEELLSQLIDSYVLH